MTTLKTILYDLSNPGKALKTLAEAMEIGDEVIISPVDPYRELRKAQDEGKKLQMRCSRDGNWIDVTIHLSFDLPPENYRIKPDKVKMWQWVYRSQLGRVRSTSEFFRSQEEAADLYPYVTLLKRADWTEIEVEQ